MTLTKLSSTDAFVVVDLDGAEKAGGVVRCARKVLQDGAKNLARHLTYGFAALEIQASGASAGINAEGDAVGAAVGAFDAEVAAMGVRIDAAKGVDPALLTQIDGTDDRSALRVSCHDALLGASSRAAVQALRPSLEGLRFASEAPAATTAAIRSAVEAAGATWTDVAPGTLDAESDVLVAGSKVGIIDHENISKVTASVILAAAPLPITARGLANATRAEISVLPDFVTLGGPLAGWWPADGATEERLVAEVAARVTGLITDAMKHPSGLFLGACEIAEQFLLTWQDSLPFGRPIA